MFWRLVRKTVTAPCLQMLCSCFAGVRPVQHGNAKTTNFNTPQGNLKSQVRLPLLLCLSSVVYTSAPSCSPARAGHGGLMSPACVRIRPPPPRRTPGTLSCQWDCRRGSYLPCVVAPAHRRVLIFPQLSASVLQSGWLQYTRRALASNVPNIRERRSRYSLRTSQFFPPPLFPTTVPSSQGDPFGSLTSSSLSMTVPTRSPPVRLQPKETDCTDGRAHQGRDAEADLFPAWPCAAASLCFMFRPQIPN
ncbi:hypothetical protein BDP67DRAFT_275022 [Colletotrichum lupini]|nr:hypothetical protein BDP67DRAFT_275022 [Colletotrichum lupini]